jgi:hypothetical protein
MNNPESMRLLDEVESKTFLAIQYRCRIWSRDWYDLKNEFTQLRTLLSALPETKGEAVAWHLSGCPDGEQTSFTTTDGIMASSYAQLGWKQRPLFFHPAPPAPGKVVVSEDDVVFRAPLCASGWRSMDTAPKDGTSIMAWCVHAADPYYEPHVDTTFADTKLTPYGTHCEGCGHVDDGFMEVHWLPGWEEGGGEEPVYHLPGWWFATPFDLGVAANPVLWRPIEQPTAEELAAVLPPACKQCDGKGVIIAEPDNIDCHACAGTGFAGRVENA